MLFQRQKIKAIFHGMEPEMMSGVKGQMLYFKFNKLLYKTFIENQSNISQHNFTYFYIFFIVFFSQGINIMI